MLIPFVAISIVIHLCLTSVEYEFKRFLTAVAWFAQTYGEICHRNPMRWMNFRVPIGAESNHFFFCTHLFFWKMHYRPAYLLNYARQASDRTAVVLDWEIRVFFSLDFYFYFVVETYCWPVNKPKTHGWKHIHIADTFKPIAQLLVFFDWIKNVSKYMDHRFRETTARA